MFGVRTPGTHPVFMLELDDGNPLAVFGKKAFMRNVAGHRLRQFDHAIDKGDVFLARARAQAGTKNSDDHGRISLPCDGRAAGHARPIPILNDHHRNLRSMPIYSTLASIASMSSSDSPKWCPISCTRTWVTISPRVSSCSAQ